MGYPAIAIKDNLYKLLYTPQEQYKQLYLQELSSAQRLGGQAHLSDSPATQHQSPESHPDLCRKQEIEKRSNSVPSWLGLL